MTTPGTAACGRALLNLEAQRKHPDIATMQSHQAHKDVRAQWLPQLPGFLSSVDDPSWRGLPTTIGTSISWEISTGYNGDQAGPSY
jgi:hypothetical protein